MNDCHLLLIRSLNSKFIEYEFKFVYEKQTKHETNAY